jgi:pSer/pThr/pTyr-binding forkhead associated (FHA) protein
MEYRVSLDDTVQGKSYGLDFSNGVEEIVVGRFDEGVEGSRYFENPKRGRIAIPPPNGGLLRVAWGCISAKHLCVYQREFTNSGNTTEINLANQGDLEDALILGDDLLSNFQYYISDMNSKNRTFHNNSPLLSGESAISNGDRLRLGEYELIFRIIENCD